MKYFSNFIIILIILIIPSLAFGEKVYLKDGSMIVGKIVEQTADFIFIQTKVGRLKIGKSEILKIVYSETKDSKFEFGERWISIGFAVGRDFLTDASLRELYGNAFVIKIPFSYFVGKKDEIELVVSYSKRESDILDKTDLTKIPVSVYYKRILRESAPFFLYWAIGGSYTYARVSTSGLVETQPETDPIEKFTQIDKGFGVNSILGTYIFLQRITLFVETEYAITFLGDSKSGRLGNVGGIEFNIGTKINF